VGVDVRASIGHGPSAFGRRVARAVAADDRRPRIAAHAAFLDFGLLRGERRRRGGRPIAPADVTLRRQRAALGGAVGGRDSAAVRSGERARPGSGTRETRWAACSISITGPSHGFAVMLPSGSVYLLPSTGLTVCDGPAEVIPAPSASAGAAGTSSAGTSVAASAPAVSPVRHLRRARPTTRRSARARRSNPEPRLEWLRIVDSPQST
jgi:hypothetical protein